MEEWFALLVEDVERAAGDAGKHARESCANQLNQSVRRLWQAGDVAELADTLADGAAQFGGGAAVLSIDGGMVKLESVRPGDGGQAVGGQTALDAAPALAAAIQSREPVIAAATESEVGETLARLASSSGNDRVAVFPATSHHAVTALVCVWGAVQAAAVELLSQVAGGEFDRLLRAATLTLPVGGLVNIAPADDTWENLPAREQALHLRAQRFARVRVAEWRLHDGAAVRTGRERSDLYGALGPQIEEARDHFRREFLEPCPSMVDYLHREMVHTLAKDDAQLLGKDYPGPLL